ncbi:DNA repair protein RadC [Vibrio sp. SCSIO 43169]|uniref:RadC family protein n=1 Tax=Vibrio sp. SCSIO 43169 TaxID=2822801 RepID=UPI002042FA1B|nr:DNA repair protein RadC [Vibrio sp. SCSIO 43169]MCM5506722.1 DNA repair protein RadC [Vibrio sp. SCSIO 43169]
MPNNDYDFSLPTCAKQVLEKAAEILADNYLRGDTYSNPDKVKEFLRYKLGGLEREAFAVMLLDNQNRLIEYNELFYGTIDAANIYPREVVKLALKTNAASVIFAHNHPSGDAEPSTQDKRVTQRLADALALVDIRVLDHFIVGETCVSFAERGLL